MQFLAKLAALRALFKGSKNFPIQLINSHQIQLQILYLPYLSSQYPHYHHPYPDLHPLRHAAHTKCRLVVQGRLSFSSPSRIQFPPHLFFIHFCSDLEGLACFHGSVSRLDSSLCVCASRGQNGRVEVSSCPCHLKYSVYLYGFGTFSETCRTATYSHLCKSHRHK